MMNLDEQDLSLSRVSMYIEATAEEIWSFFATPEGWKKYLCDMSHMEVPKTEVEEGDRLILTIGELTNSARCVTCVKPALLVFDEQYSSILPDGSLWSYELRTSFTIERKEHVCKVTVIVEGYDDGEMMQWIRQCGETGWRQSLYNLKCVIELGLDLRNDIFNYPRMGVLNYTATSEQLDRSGLSQRGLRGNYIKKVYPNSPAAKAGLADGIIVIRVNGEPVPHYHDFIRVLSGFYQKQSAVQVDYYEGEQYKSATVYLTYQNEFTGMVDPVATPLDVIRAERLERARGQETGPKEGQ